MIEQKASDSAVDSAPSLYHLLSSGRIWSNVSYCLREINGTYSGVTL